LDIYCISDRNVSDRNVSDRNVSDRNVSDRNVSDRNVSDRNVSDRNVSDRNVSDRNVGPFLRASMYDERKKELTFIKPIKTQFVLKKLKFIILILRELSLNRSTQY
jgi:Zn/Cd-binding protein ZinT